MATTYTGTARNDGYIITDSADKIIEAANGGIDGVGSSVSYTLPTNVENLTLTGSANIYGAGNNADNVLTGNSGHNRLNSGRGNDTVYGGDGNDNINGGTGNDFLDGGNGQDNINGEAGDDKIFGGDGNDILRGGEGNDELNGGYGFDDDILDGGTGNDVLWGGGGNDTFVFGAGYGNDRIAPAHYGQNTIQFKELTADQVAIEVKTSAEGVKSWVFSVGEDTLTVEGIGNSDDKDAGWTFVFADQSYSTAEFAALKGVELYDTDVQSQTISGTDAAETLTGTSGDDTIDGGKGADTMIGLDGKDAYYVDNAGDKIIETVNGGTDSVYSSVSHTLATNVENLTLTGSANIYGAGNNADNVLTGNSGHNRLNSGRGNDTVYGGDGNDTLNGGSGDDVLNGDAGNGLLNGEQGSDTLQGGAGNDIYLFGEGYGSDKIIDNEGTDTVKFSDGLTVKDLHIEAVANGSGGKDWVISLDGRDDTLTIADQETAAGAHAVAAFVISGKSYGAAELYDAVNAGNSGVIKNFFIGNQNGAANTPENDFIEGLLGPDVYRFGKGSGQDTVFDFVLKSDEEYLNTFRGQNTVVFTGGITPDDLDITISKGYDASLLKDHTPGEWPGTTTMPVDDGDTWVIRIKGSDDVLTILNQKPAMGAMARFEFEGMGENGGLLTYTASQLFDHIHQGMSGEEIANANASQSYTANDETRTLTHYGTAGNDEFNLNEYRPEYFMVHNSNNQVIYGGSGNDRVLLGMDSYSSSVSFYGGSGDDIIGGNTHHAGIKVFDGGTGDDEVITSTNIQTIVFRAGDGHDIIHAESGVSAIHFTGGLTLNDLSIEMQNDNEMTAVITIKETGDSITLPLIYSNIANPMYPATTIRFDSGESHSLSDIPAARPTAAPVLDIGSDVVHTESAELAGYTVSVNEDRIRSLNADNHDAHDHGLLDTAAGDALDAGINGVTAAVASPANVAGDVAYAPSESMNLIDDSAHVAAVM